MIDTIHSNRREAIEQWLTERFSQLSDVSPEDIDIDRPFADYRLDSAVAVTVSREFGAWLQRELPITLFWEYPTIRGLASALDADMNEARS